MGRRCGLLVLLAASLGAAGCGSASGTVKGKVSYNGAPLKGGTVTFFYPDGRGFPIGILADGTYTLDRLPLGPVKVCVDTSSLDPKKHLRYSYAPPPGAKPPPGFSPTSAEAYVAIPAKYADPAKTDLTYDVTGGTQTHDIELK
jgi:hypothetical protein